MWREPSAEQRALLAARLIILERNGWNYTHAAREIGITQPACWMYFASHGVERPAWAHKTRPRVVGIRQGPSGIQKQCRGPCGLWRPLARFSRGCGAFSTQNRCKFCASKEQSAYYANKRKKRLNETTRSGIYQSMDEAAFTAMLAEVAALFGVTPADLLGRSRIGSIPIARRAAMDECRRRWQWSTTQIGKAFGNRDHTTVVAALASEERRLERNARKTAWDRAHPKAKKERRFADENPL